MQMLHKFIERLRRGKWGILVQGFFIGFSELIHPPNNSFGDILLLPPLVVDHKNTAVEHTSGFVEGFIRQPGGSIRTPSLLNLIQLCKIEVHLKPLRTILDGRHRMSLQIHIIQILQVPLKSKNNNQHIRTIQTSESRWKHSYTKWWKFGDMRWSKHNALIHQIEC